MKRAYVVFLILFACGSTNPIPLEPEASLGQAILPKYQRVVVGTSPTQESWMKSIGDFNGDGKPDLMLAGHFGPVWWYENPTWTRHTVIATQNEVEGDSGSDVADIDGDGDIDIAVGFTLFYNQNRGSSWVRYQIPQFQGVMTHDVVVADINRDGKLDVINRGELDTKIAVYLQNTPTSWTPFIIDPRVGLQGLQVADINRDGRLDLVVAGAWMEQPQSGATTGSKWIKHTFTSWDGTTQSAHVEVADMDVDGRPDILLSVAEHVGKLSWFKAPADPTTGPWKENVIAPQLTEVHAFVVADLDRDGLLDVTASEYEADGRLINYRNLGGALSWSSTVLGTDQLHNIRAADFNQDCQLDFYGVNPFGTKPIIVMRSIPANACGGGSGTGGSPSTGGASNSGGRSTGGAQSGGVGSGGRASGGAGGSAGTSGAFSGGSSSTGGTGTAGQTSRMFGETAVLGVDDSGNAGLVVTQRAVLSQAGTLRSLSFYVAAAAGKLRLGVYDATGPNAGPGALKASTAEITAPVVGWNTANVTKPIVLPAGDYWLAYQPSSNTIGYKVESSGSSKYMSRSYSQGLPATFARSPVSTTAHWSFYGTTTQ